jgi:hypothetical protein
MTNNIDHDRLFNELISTFFIEFIELFFPQLIDYLDRESITFLDKEVFTDVTEGERYESDLVAQVKFRGKESFGSSLPFMLNQQTRCQDNILLTQKFRKFLKP